MIYSKLVKLPSVKNDAPLLFPRTTKLLRFYLDGEHQGGFEKRITLFNHLVPLPLLYGLGGSGMTLYTYEVKYLGKIKA